MHDGAGHGSQKSSGAQEGPWPRSMKPRAFAFLDFDVRGRSAEQKGRASVKGFLGTWASFSADLNILVQIAMGIALLAGAFLARAKRYAAHGACQAVVLILNLPMIALVMWPSLHMRVLPRLSKHFGKPYYAIAMAHGVLGALAEVLGFYILLVAGTNFLPHSWRFQRWKLWMRIELALWWVVLLSGIGTYYIWYATPRSH
jgi:uncharacterized membrane protein YozB (DUF420 family)